MACQGQAQITEVALPNQGSGLPKHDCSWFSGDLADRRGRAPASARYHCRQLLTLAALAPRRGPPGRTVRLRFRRGGRSHVLRVAARAARVPARPGLLGNRSTRGCGAV